MQRSKHARLQQMVRRLYFLYFFFLRPITNSFLRLILRDLPRRHHYANSNRIPSILVDMTVSWRGL